MDAREERGLVIANTSRIEKNKLDSSQVTMSCQMQHRILIV